MTQCALPPPPPLRMDISEDETVLRRKTTIVDERRDMRLSIRLNSSNPSINQSNQRRWPVGLAKYVICYQQRG